MQIGSHEHDVVDAMALNLVRTRSSSERHYCIFAHATPCCRQARLASSTTGTRAVAVAIGVGIVPRVAFCHVPSSLHIVMTDNNSVLSKELVEKVSAINVFDNKGNKVVFGDLFASTKTIVIFVRK